MKKKEISKLFSDKHFQRKLNKVVSLSDEQKLRHDKHVAFYSVVADYWFDARNKENQTSIAIASGAIGLLIALSSNKGLLKLSWYFLLYPIALLAFLVVILVGIYTFRKNSDYLMVLKEACESPKKSSSLPPLAYLDYISTYSLGTGIICSVAFFIIHIIVSILSN